MSELENNIISADVIDYIGKYEEGILVLLSIKFNDTFTEGTLFYSKDMVALTVDEEVEIGLGYQIEFWDGYRDLLTSILKKVVPFDEIVNRLDIIDFAKYLNIDDLSSDNIKSDSEDIDNNEISQSI